jgi:hypothetical protein
VCGQSLHEACTGFLVFQTPESAGKWWHIHFRTIQREGDGYRGNENEVTVDGMTQAVQLTTITRWDYLPNAQTIRMTASGSDGKTYLLALPTLATPGVLG